MMKKILLSLCSLSAVLSAVGQPAFWGNEKISADNKEPSRTQFVSYDRRDDAETFVEDKSPFFLPLNGEWLFRRTEGPGAADTAFLAGEGEGTRVSVPGLWTDTPASELEAMKAPMLPEANPVGQYRAEAMIPVFWLDRDIFIRVAGARPGVTLYVNGRRVGYSEDAGAPAEFNIRPYVKEGRNVIGLEIPKWTTGSRLENGDLRGAGIEGGVWLYSQPRVHIADFSVNTALDSAGRNGVLDLSIILEDSFNSDEQATVYFDLMDAAGNVVRYNYREVTVPGVGGRDTVRFEAAVPNVMAWSPDSPYLYRMMLRVRHEGYFKEYIPYKLGFQELKRGEDGRWYVNGKPLLIKGVNYEYAGGTVDEKSLRAELARLKAAGVNALKCHYHPLKNRLYELCAEYGFYICDGVNIDSFLSGDSRYMGGTLANDPAWLDAHLFRVENAWRHNRNHTGLVMWSLGERSGIGYNLYKAYDRMRELDSLRRPVAYDQARNYWSTDVFFPANPNAETIVRWAEGVDSRPGVASAFSAPSENADSIGRIWESLSRSAKWQGGFATGISPEALRALYREPVAKPSGNRKKR